MNEAGSRTEQPDDRTSGEPPAESAEEFFGLSTEFTQGVIDALEEDREAEACEQALALHYADLADLIEALPGELRPRLVDLVRADFDPETLTALDEVIRDEVIEILGFADLAQAVRELNSDDAVYLVDKLSTEEQARVLEALPPEDQAIILQGLAYPEYSAGRLMARELVAVPMYYTVGETIDYLRANPHLPDDFYDIFVVDPRHRPVGKVALNRLLRSKRPVKLQDILDEEVHQLPVTMDQEEIAWMFRQQDWVSAPVVDNAGRLIGVITVDDVVDVIDEEAADDMLRMAGVADTDLYRAVLDTTRARFSWLLVNLGTAVVASLVIGLFEATLQQAVALAVLMPIVASMGGNAGTQTLTVAVRSLAMKELTPTNAMRVIGKEALVGLFNGLMFAVLTGLIAWFWFGDGTIGFVIAAAMVINLVAAGLSGTLIPLGLERLGVDPAIASTVFLTTITDVVGFLSFLGLAAIFLL